MKRFLLLFTLLVVLVLPVQAIFVAWELGTDGSAAVEQGKTDWWTSAAGYTYSYQFVYSTTVLDAKSVAEVAQSTSSTVSKRWDGPIKAEMPDQANARVDWAWDTTGKITSGYFYVVVFNASASSVTENTLYSVAGEVAFTEYNEHGIYANAAGTKPNDPDYYEVSWLEGGTWGRSPGTPEPTTVTLLALGLAGLALRRKVR